MTPTPPDSIRRTPLTLSRASAGSRLDFVNRIESPRRFDRWAASQSAGAARPISGAARRIIARTASQWFNPDQRR